jgi:hypothetical protein
LQVFSDVEVGLVERKRFEDRRVLARPVKPIESSRERLSRRLTPCGFVYFRAVPPVLWSKLYYRPMEIGGDGQRAFHRLVRPLPEAVEGIHHRSSRRPLKNGWRTFPSADLARYSISASSFGSTQMPLCAIRLV